MKPTTPYPWVLDGRDDGVIENRDLDAVDVQAVGLTVDRGELGLGGHARLAGSPGTVRPSLFLLGTLRKERRT
jgi:hypothetical protein